MTGTATWPLGFRLPADVEPAYDRVVLVTIDTLRADHVSAYGYRRPTSPFLDSLAASGVLFEQAMASVSHTAPSHASILTGLPPVAHGVLHNGDKLDPSAQDLGRLFREAGFETGAFLNTSFLSSVATTFDVKESLPELSDTVVDAALAWLDEAGRSERFFLWVHSFDPHHWTTPKNTPQDLVDEIREQTDLDDDALYDHLASFMGLPDPAPGERYRIPWVSKTKRRVSSRREYLDLADAYDALILHADRQLERLYRAFEERGLGGRTLWIVTSDHGEGMGSHGVLGHGGYVYQEQLRVPLVVHAMDDSLGPRRVPELVQHVDLFPTIAATLGARTGGVEPARMGTSLWPLIEGTGAWVARPAFSHRRPQTVTVEEMKLHDEESWNAVWVLQTLDAKYVLRRADEDEFYDLAADPLELENLADASGEVGAELAEDLDERIRLYLALRREAFEGGGVSEEVLEELRALGYVE